MSSIDQTCLTCNKRIIGTAKLDPGDFNFQDITNLVPVCRECWLEKAGKKYWITKDHKKINLVRILLEELPKLASEDILDWSKKLMQDSDWEIREKGAEFMRSIDPEEFPAVKTQLHEFVDYKTKGIIPVIADIVRKYGSSDEEKEWIYRTLEAMLASSDEAFSREAVFLLKELDPPKEDLELFSRFLTSGDSWTRIYLAGSFLKHPDFHQLVTGGCSDILSLEEYESRGRREKLERFISTNKKSGPMRIYVTGKIQDYTKKEIREMVEKKGFKWSATIGKNLDFLVTGYKPGPTKIEKADKLRITTIGWDEFKSTFLNQ
ncbi:MAG: BRCT domain-containing protein [Candidatus Odinarchaeota archaeon]